VLGEGLGSGNASLVQSWPSEILGSGTWVSRGNYYSARTPMPGESFLGQIKTGAETKH